MTISIEFTPGLPPPVTGTCIFLLSDGTLCEGVLHRDDGRLMLTTCNIAEPHSLEKITMPAEGKVQAYARNTGHQRPAS